MSLNDNVIYVGFNYRLNIFGFYGDDKLRARDTEAGSTGNYGVQDQRAAGMQPGIPSARARARARV